MKSLNEYITESLLDDLEDLEKDSDNTIIKRSAEKFLKENYYIRGNYTINNGVVDVKSDVVVKNKNLTELTNGVFVFGTIRGAFICSECDKLKSLKGAPKEVGGNFDCSWCTKLTSLEGAPKEVGRKFDCTHCKNLTSLKGAPEKVGSNFDCSRCKSLTSLEGAPKKVGSNFDCSHCNGLTSLKGAPKEVGWNFSCDRCGTSFTEEYVKSVSNVKKNIYV